MSMNDKNVQITTDINTGLTAAQVKERVSRGLINGKHEAKTKSIKQIILTNTCTLFNLINFLLAACVLFVQSYKNLLFMGVILANLFIGIIQEIRAKITIDKLSLISAPQAKVLRDGKYTDVAMEDIVKDDICLLKRGDQICADSIVADGSCDVDESLLTGENDPVHKEPGDEVLSGSFIVSGEVKAFVKNIGADNYAYKIVNEAKYLKKPSSEMMNAINKIIKLVSICIIPMAAITFYKQFVIINQTFDKAVVSTVAALIAMIPEGLVLLSSIVLAVSVIRLSREKTLVQELYCIETLARVNVLCLDKTGTITEGQMRLLDVIDLKSGDIAIEKILCSMVNTLNDDNPTFLAIKKKYNKATDWVAAKQIPFSSERKWSMVSFEKYGSYVLGAAEFVLSDEYLKEYSETINRYTGEGCRVLVLAHSDSMSSNSEDGKVILPEYLQPVGFILIGDKVRKEAKDTLNFFAQQGVGLKIISGDQPATVSKITKQAGLEGYETYIDATTLKTDEEVSEAADKYTVFGRVTPRQKLLLIKALKARGNTVGMTGDGVNDVLALKESDCSVAMQSGSDAARNVSKLVLLNSNFASMPKVVAEGRRSINNLERSATLFLVKTVYAILLGLAFIFINAPYPFIPIQLTLINALTIGVPSFLLALEPNYNLVKGHFFKNVMKTSLPGGIMVVINVITTTYLSMAFDATTEQTATLASILTAIISFMVLIRICRPFNIFRTIMVSVLIAGFAVAVIFFKDFFNFVSLSWPLCCIIIGQTALSALAIKPFMDFVKRLFEKNK